MTIEIATYSSPTPHIIITNPTTQIIDILKSMKLNIEIYRDFLIIIT